MVFETKNRLRFIREHKRLSAPVVAKQIEISPQYLYELERGEKRLNETMLNKLADFYGTTTDFLLGREVELQMGIASSKPVPVPILGTIRAGEPIDIIEDYQDVEWVNSELLKSRDAFVLIVSGDSMIGDNIHDGDKVVVVVQQEVTASDIAVVAINDEAATLKRLKTQGEMCILMPSNPLVEPMVVDAKVVRVLGKVVEIRQGR